jgi:cell division protein FtsX
VSGAWLVRRTVRRIGRRPRQFAALAAAFAAIAALATAAVELGRSASRTADAFIEQVHVIVYLDHGLDRERARALQHALERLPDVLSVREVGSQAAKQRLGRAVAALGQDAALLEQAEDGFLPRSMEVALWPGPDLPARAAELARRLGPLEGVAAVDAMKEGLGKVAGWVALARRMAMVLGALALLAGLGLLLWILAGERRRGREEAETFALVGATATEARGPAALAGALAALAGALVGLSLGRPVAALLAPGTTIGPGERAIALGALLLLGLLAGWTSLPRPRAAAPS